MREIRSRYVFPDSEADEMHMHVLYQVDQAGRLSTMAAAETDLIKYRKNCPPPVIEDRPTALPSLLTLPLTLTSDFDFSLW